MTTGGFAFGIACLLITANCQPWSLAGRESGLNSPVGMLLLRMADIASNLAGALYHHRTSCGFWSSSSLRLCHRFLEGFGFSNQLEGQFGSCQGPAVPEISHPPGNVPCKLPASRLACALAMESTMPRQPTVNTGLAGPPARHACSMPSFR